MSIIPWRVVRVEIGNFRRLYCGDPAASLTGSYFIEEAGFEAVDGSATDASQPMSKGGFCFFELLYTSSFLVIFGLHG